MRILLIGATGQLGGDLVRSNPGHEIAAPGRDALDLERGNEAVAAVEAYRPDVLINCAAFHNVPQCESEGERAFRVNCLAVRDLARACRRVRARFVTFSTDYVFGGDVGIPYAEDDRPMPLQVYGTTRLAGEYAALWEAPECAWVIRTCGLYGFQGAQSKGGSFVDKRVEDGRRGGVLEMGSDQTVCPTFTEDLSGAVWQLLAHPGAEPGIYHLVNEGQCTWAEFTEAIFEIAELDCKVVAVDRGGRTGEMRRPLYSVLANTRARALGITLPEWKDALRRYIRQKYGSLKSPDVAS